MISVQSANECLQDAGEDVDAVELIEAGRVKARSMDKVLAVGDSARAVFKTFGFDVEDWPEADTYKVGELADLASVTAERIRNMLASGEIEQQTETRHAIDPESLDQYINRTIKVRLPEVRERLGLSKAELCEEYLRGRIRLQRDSTSGAVRAENFYVTEQDLEAYPQAVFTPDWQRGLSTMEMHSATSYRDAVPHHVIDVVQYNKNGVAQAWGTRDEAGQKHAPLQPFKASLTWYMQQRMQRTGLMTLQQFRGFLPTLKGAVLDSLCDLAGLDTDVDEEDKRAALAEHAGIDPNMLKTEYSVADAADVLGVSEKTVYRRLEDGTLGGEKAGKTWTISRAALESYHDEHGDGGELFGAGGQ